MKTAEIVVAIGDSVSDTTQKTTENTTMMSTRDHGKVNIDFEASIDTTTSFKYMRNLEKVFESIPESIPQLVFFMTTSFNTATGQESINDDISLLLISILSIHRNLFFKTLNSKVTLLTVTTTNCEPCLFVVRMVFCQAVVATG